MSTIEVLDIEEHKDGSATVTLELSEEVRDMLVSYAITELLKKTLDNEQ